MSQLAEIEKHTKEILKIVETYEQSVPENPKLVVMLREAQDLADDLRQKVAYWESKALALEAKVDRDALEREALNNEVEKLQGKLKSAENAKTVLRDRIDHLERELAYAEARQNALRERVDHLEREAVNPKIVSMSGTGRMVKPLICEACGVEIPDATAWLTDDGKTYHHQHRPTLDNYAAVLHEIARLRRHDAGSSEECARCIATEVILHAGVDLGQHREAVVEKFEKIEADEGNRAVPMRSAFLSALSKIAGLPHPAEEDQCGPCLARRVIPVVKSTAFGGFRSAVTANHNAQQDALKGHSDDSESA